MSIKTKKEKTITQIDKFLDKLLTKRPDFYGQIELNFNNGNVPNINVKYSEKFDKLKT